jgi:hypothetical protein
MDDAFQVISNKKIARERMNITNFSDLTLCSVIVWLYYTSDIPEEWYLVSHYRKSSISRSISKITTEVLQFYERNILVSNIRTTK